MKKLLLICVLLLNTLFISKAQVDPCTNITTIKCDSVITFSVSGAGNPNYPNGMNGQGCPSSGTAQGGLEKIYRFTATTTGTYQFNVLSGPGSGYAANYYWKYDSLGCSNTDWNCIDRTSTSKSLAAFNWKAGDVILILVNAEVTISFTETFKITCGTRVCDNIQNIKCDSVITFSVYGFGNPDYPNGMNGQGCPSSGTAQGGLEKIYRFTATTTGTYQFNVLSGPGSGYAANYYWKYDSLGCSNTDWNCIDRTSTSKSLAAFNWKAGDVILILVNAEVTISFTETFKITCGTRVCDNIQNIKCDSVITFSVYGFGNPDYPNGMNGQGCPSSGTAQGGLEKIYRFTATTTGTYQFNVLSGPGSGYAANYYWKYDSLGCSNTDWNCIDRTSTSKSLAAFNWKAGDVILILVNAEVTISFTETFKITCGTRVCDNIKNINCGDTVKYSVYGYGNPDYPNNFSANSCAITTTGQGGLEKIYRLPPINGVYQISILSASGNVEYLWKYDSICCSNTGWNCIGAKSGLFNFPAITPVPGASVLIMLNSEASGTVSHNFKVTCVPNIISTTPSCIYATSSTICKNDSTKLIAQQGYLAPGDTLKWYKGSCGGAVIGTGASITVNPTANSTYYVRAVSNNIPKTSCAEITITVKSLPTAPTITISGPTTFCAGTTPLTLTSSASAGYQWLKGGNIIPGATTKNYKPTAGGTHKVTITNSNGCSSTSVNGVVVTLNPLPTATITPLGPLTFCAGGNVTLQANSGTGLTYQWKVGSTIIPGVTSQNYVASTAGTYKVIVTNANLCSKTSSGKKVVINCRVSGDQVENMEDMQIELYPNPTNDNLTINLNTDNDGTSTICIYNTAGEKMLCKTVEVLDGNYQNQFDVSSFPNGMYMLIVEKDNSRITERFVKN